MDGIGDAIKRARVARGWSQSRLADALNQAAGHTTLDRHYVARWERGARTPDTFWRGYIERVLGTGEEHVRRRDLFGMIGGIAAGSALAGLPAALTGDAEPAAYFTATLRTLVDNDNLFGPGDVIPRAEAHIAALGHASADAREADRVELVHLRARYAEFAGWLHEDHGNHSAALHWTDRALEWSYIAADPELTVYVLARKAQLACDMRDPHTAAGLGHAAVTVAPHPKLAAIASTYTAQGHALSGDTVSMERAYHSAREFVAASHDACPWGAWLDDAYIDVHRAQSLAELGMHRGAADVFDAAIESLPGGYHRDRGVYLARAARAHAGSGDLEHATTLGVRALAIATDTHSGRTATELTQLDTMLAPLAGRSAAVQRFQQAMRATNRPPRT